MSSSTPGVVSQVEVPTINADDMRAVVSLIDWIERHDPDGDLTIEAGTRIVLWNKNDYPVGSLAFDEDHWSFTPHADWASDESEGR